MSFPIEASCQCGQVSYTLKAAPKMVLACHCKECQKLATAPFSVTAIVAANDIEFSGRMGEWERMAASGNKNSARFCLDCGNRIYHINPDSPQTIKLKLKPVAYENTRMFEPSAHVWVKEKADWYVIPDGVEVFETQPKL